MARKRTVSENGQGNNSHLTPEVQKAFDIDSRISGLTKVGNLLFDQTGPLWHGPANWAEAILALALINLNDVLQWIQREGRTLADGSDLPPGTDLATHIKNMRNAACHVRTDRMIGNGSLQFGHLTRKSCQGTWFGDVHLENPYEAEVAFFFGAKLIFLVRHLQRAAIDAAGHLSALAAENEIIWPSVCEPANPLHPYHRPLDLTVRS